MFTAYLRASGHLLLCLKTSKTLSFSLFIEHFMRSGRTSIDVMYQEICIWCESYLEKLKLIKPFSAELIKCDPRSTYPRVTLMLVNDSDSWSHPSLPDQHLNGQGLAFPTSSPNLRTAALLDMGFELVVGYWHGGEYISSLFRNIQIRIPWSWPFMAYEIHRNWAFL